MHRRAPRKIQVGEQDLELLRFLAEHRFVLPDHVAHLLGRSADTARSRLDRLVEAGYVRREDLFRGRQPMHLIRSSGLKAIGSTLKSPRLDLRSYEHDVGVAWLWLAAGRGTFGPLREVIGERRLRAHDGGRDPGADPLGVRLGGVGPRGQERLHYPDLLLMTADGRRIALELELSSKGRVRLETILAGYGADRRIDGVVYLVDSPSVARSVTAAARRQSVSWLVHLQRVRLSTTPRDEIRGPAAARPAPDRSAAATHPARSSELAL